MSVRTPTLLAADYDAVERRLFELAIENTTAHQPRIDDPVRAIGHANDDGDDTVVAELVDQPDLQSETVRRFFERHHLGFGVASRGQIELIGLIDQLRDAGPGYAVKAAYHGLHFE